MEPILPEPMPQVSHEELPEVQGTSAVEVTAENRPNIVSDTAAETRSSVQSTQAQATPDPAPVQVIDPVSTVPTGDPVQASGSGPTIADDVDVIEKEWVDKAKQIVSTTQGDPRMQEKEVSKLQADYLQKRYNKTIKLPE